MVELTTEELKQHFSDDIFKRISETADELGLECYVVGGYVRDIFLQRPSKDIDVVVVGSGIEMAEALGKCLGRGAHVAVFKNFEVRVKNHINVIRVNLLLKMVRWKMIRIVVILLLMHWLSV